MARPPYSLLADCVKTPVLIVVNKDLSTALEVRNKDLDICSADKAALRAWYDKE